MPPAQCYRILDTILTAELSKCGRAIESTVALVGSTHGSGTAGSFAKGGSCRIGKGSTH